MNDKQTKKEKNTLFWVGVGALATAIGVTIFNAFYFQCYCN
ncbi:hypothetical protein [uncultured Nostoc sp.]